MRRAGTRRRNLGRARRWGLAAALVGAGGMLWLILALGALRLVPGTEASGAVLASRLTPEERAAIAAGRVRFLDGLAACRLVAGADRGGADGSLRLAPLGEDRGEPLVILNTPAVFRTAKAPLGGKGDGERVRLVTAAAVRLRARLMVDCTDADLARLTPEGWRSLREAKRAGLWRMVVFDGAHHLPALAADPELLLLPLLAAGREPLIIHGYVRDALPLPALRLVLTRLGAEPALLALPRLSLPLKETLPLRLVVLQALRRVVAAGSPVGQAAGPAPRPGRRIPLDRVEVSPGVARLPGGLALVGRAVEERRGPGEETAVVELGLPFSVWDLLLRYPAALAGRPLPGRGRRGAWEESRRGLSNNVSP